MWYWTILKEHKNNLSQYTLIKLLNLLSLVKVLNLYKSHMDICAAAKAARRHEFYAVTC